MLWWGLAVLLGRGRGGSVVVVFLRLAFSIELAGTTCDSYPFWLCESVDVQVSYCKYRVGHSKKTYAGKESGLKFCLYAILMNVLLKKRSMKTFVARWKFKLHRRIL